MWGSDHQHTNGIWPEPAKYIAEQFADLSPEVVHDTTLDDRCGGMLPAQPIRPEVGPPSRPRLAGRMRFERV
jgi:hypothetical protein